MAGKAEPTEKFGQGYQTIMDYADPGGFLHGQPIAPTYLGGSAEEQARLQEQQRQGIALGNNYTAGGIDMANQGAGMLTAANDMSLLDRAAAESFAAQGQQLGQGAVTSQDRAIRSMIDAASMNTASAAEAQMRMGANQANAAMMAQAASARGGNQAAAMRGAQANAVQNYGNIMNAAGVMRAQEDAARANRMAAAQQAAAGAYGQRVGLGYGMQGQGLGYGMQSTQTQAGIGGQVVSAGLGQGSLGAQTTGQYLDAQTQSNIAIMDAEQRRKAAELEQKGGLLGGLTSGIGSLLS